MAFTMSSKPRLPATPFLDDELSLEDAQAIVRDTGSRTRPPLSSILGNDLAPATRHTYWADGEWRINFNGTEYSGFAWIDRLAAFENLGLEPAEVQRAYDICIEFLNNMDCISVSEIQNYAKARKEGRLLILPESHINTLISDVFREPALAAYRNGKNTFVCPYCKQTGDIYPSQTGKFITAQCRGCKRATAINLDAPKQE